LNDYILTVIILVVVLIIVAEFIFYEIAM